jgi:hypothetical protein
MACGSKKMSKGSCGSKKGSCGSKAKPAKKAK